MLRTIFDDPDRADAYLCILAGCIRAFLDSSGFPKVLIGADLMLSGHTHGGQDRLPRRRRLGTAHALVTSRRDFSSEAAFGTGDFLIQGRNLT